MTPRIQYVTASDGGRSAYTSFGDGDGVPVVALRPSLFSNVEAEWQLPLQLDAISRVKRMAPSRRCARKA